MLSDDVLQHFRESRNPNGDYSGRVKFSERERDDVVSQEITSAKTSIKQVAGLFKDKNAKFGKTNIDVGGGRFNLVTDYLAERGTKNMVFDPYNRGVDENTATRPTCARPSPAGMCPCAGCSAIWTDRPTGEKTFLTEAAKENAADHGGVQHSDCQTLGGLGRDFQESVSASKRRKISAV